MANIAKLILSVFDGSRRLIDQDVDLLVTLRDGNGKEIHRDYHHGPKIEFEVPFYNNLGDNYAVIAWAEHYQQAGFVPVKVTPSVDQAVDLMLLPGNPEFDFAQAQWPVLSETHPWLVKLLAHGAASPDQAESRYQELMKGEQASLASFLNITTAMASIRLPKGYYRITSSVLQIRGSPTCFAGSPADMLVFPNSIRLTQSRARPRELSPQIENRTLSEAGRTAPTALS